MGEIVLATSAHLDMMAANAALETAFADLNKAVRAAYPIGAEVRWYVNRDGRKHLQVGVVDGYVERGPEVELQVRNLWTRKIVYVPRHRLIEWIKAAIRKEFEARDAAWAAEADE